MAGPSPVIGTLAGDHSGFILDSLSLESLLPPFLVMQRIKSKYKYLWVKCYENRCHVQHGNNCSLSKPSFI